MSRLIGEAAKTLRLSADTLRYYEKIKLIPGVVKNTSGRRAYSDKDLARLRFVQRAQSVGFSLNEIGRLLKLRENPSKSSKAIRTLAKDKCDAVREQMKILKRMHDELTLLLNLCSGDSEHCPILDRLDGN
jgi:DNA-binding transcriptional MerR regulator